MNRGQQRSPEAQLLAACMRVGNFRRVAEVLGAVLAGATVKDAATAAGVHENTALRWCAEAGVRSRFRNRRADEVRAILAVTPRAELMQHLFGRVFPRCPTCGEKADRVRRITADSVESRAARWMAYCAACGPWRVPRHFGIRRPNLLARWLPQARNFFGLVEGGENLTAAGKAAGLPQALVNLIVEELCAVFDPEPASVLAEEAPEGGELGASE